MGINKNLQLIQLLRGIAALLVVFYHATSNAKEIFNKTFFFNFFLFGGAGVDIFFVLSGFIITYTSLKYIGHFNNLPSFLRRRFVRIYPAYWIIITLLLIAQLLLPSFYKTHYNFTFNNLISTYLLFPGHTMINGVSWTLTYELFFYLLFSLAFIISQKKYALLAALTYGFVLILLPVFNYNYTNQNLWANLVTFPMNTEFILGILAALIITGLPHKLNMLFIVGGTIIFLLNGVIIDTGFILVNNSFNRVILFGIPSFFIITGLVNYELNKIVSVPKLLMKLGEASYSLYLLHLPLLIAAFKMINKLNIKSNFLIHCLSILIVCVICYTSILFYKFVEKPIITKLNTLRSIKVANEI